MSVIKKVKLGVNVDHVATLRQARRDVTPDPFLAAYFAIKGGADGIVVHLREDRRHIQEGDVIKIRKNLRARLDLEMAATEEMKKFALKIKPDMVTLVPEKRQEITTEGGLDVVSNFKNLRPFIFELESAKIPVSIFVDPEPDQIEACAKTGATFIEIHTGAYANSKTKNEKLKNLNEIKKAVKLARKLGLRVNAGHGLNYENVKDIAKIDGIEELNIGFSIIARSVFVGIERAVKEMKRIIA